MNSILDAETIKTLRTYIDKEGKCLLDTLTEIFISTVPGEIKQLRSYFDSRDFSSLETSAHSLKSTAGGLGAMAMSEALAKIEEHLASLEGATPNEAMLSGWLKIVEEQLDPIVSELRKLNS
ncbi:MAG: hypothetical protein A4S09_03715 [Proteobacteria bacterium SG_bin7]|nr:MAG: hypothetical protein A4S09_03715 [Proteobacteria bacterium SG_bin7]